MSISHCTKHPTHTSVYCHECMSEKNAEIARLTASLDAAREALEAITKTNWQYSQGHECCAIANQALAQIEEGTK